MSFAIVELKYVAKKTFIIPTNWIKNYTPKHNSTQEFYSYISTNLKDDPSFEAKYYTKFNGSSGLFKVFILKITDSLIDAISYQEEKRVKSVSKKFREPSNTDAELKAEDAKRKRKENIVKKVAKRSAKEKNMAHLANVFDDKNLNNAVQISMSKPMEYEDISSERIVPFLQTKTPSKELTSSSSISNTFSDIVKEALEGEEFEAPNNTENMKITVQENPVPLPLYTLNDNLPFGNNGNNIIRIDDNVQIIHISNIPIVQDDVPQSSFTSSNTLENPMNVHLSNVAIVQDNVQQSSFAPNNTLENPMNDCNIEVIQNLQPVLKDKELVSTPSISKEFPNLVTEVEINKSNTNNNNVRTVGDAHDIVNYKEAYFQLKDKHDNLDERNLALQNALVAANKAIAKAPEVPFTMKVKVWFQNRRMKHKRQTLSKSEDDENKDSLKGDDDSQQCNSSSKKSCQGCELPSDDVPDSTSNSRGHNNNTPSATNNNSNNGSVTPNSTLDTTISTNTNGITNINIISADSSVASSVSLDEEEESPTKIKKKDNNVLVQVVKKESMITKDQFYNNMDMYRRDGDSTPMIADNGLSVTPSYSQSSSHKYNKNNITTQAIHDGYASHAYYRKQPEYYGKYEIEFAHHQKSLVAPTLPTQAEYHYQKNNFPHSRSDFHHLKGDFHTVKPELNYKAHDIHGKAAHNFHRNQNYYNQHTANPASQYPNQYYHEYEASPTIEPNNFYDSKTQTNYYENVNYYPNEYAAEPYAPPSTDNCENYTYPQYFETGQPNQMVHAAANPQPIQNNATHNNQIDTNFTQCPPSYSGSNANVNGNHNLGNLENNSNSSSDFTFLSNLANDFAPEYYQLI